MEKPTRTDRLGEIAFAHGEEFIGGGNRPIHLSDPEIVWYVVKGAVDVFVAERSEDESASDFKQLLRAGPGRLLFGAAEAGGTSSIHIAKGLVDTHLRRVPRAAFTDATAADPGAAARLAEQIEAWISDIAAAMAREVAPRPRPERFLTAGEEVESARESVLATRQGVVWVSGPVGNAAFLDTGDPIGDGPGFIPVTALSWIRLFRPSPLTVTSTQALQAKGVLFAALAEFHQLAMSADEMNRRLLMADMANLQRSQVQHRRRSEERARDSLFGVLDARRAPAADRGASLLEALKLIGDHEGIPFREPSRNKGADEGEVDLREILRESKVRARKIKLAPDDRWWRGDSGALLAFRRESGAPVALIPGRVWGRYRMVDPATGRAERVDARAARDLASEGRFFYRPLPQDEPVRSGSLFRFALRGLGKEVARFTLTGLLVGLLMLVPPVLLGVLVDRVIPSGSRWQIVQLALAAVLLAILAALLQILQGTTLMRMEAVGSARVGAALWDRMLGLTQRFFRRFSAGDLTMRAMAYQALRDQISGVVASAVLSVIFLLPTFALLFLYDTRIGWVGLVLGLVSLGVTSVLGLLQFPLYRRLLEVSRTVAGKLLQLLNGISKLRSTGSEGIGFAEWAKAYREQKHMEMRLGRLNEFLVAYLSSAPAVAVASVFAIATYGGGLGTGDFLVIYAAFMVFYAAVARLGSTFAAVAAILPAYQQMTPILDAVPETSSEGESPPEMSGDVRIDHVTFRYSKDGPPVLRGVSMHARAGEFVAIVGESGAGKSTLVRLALGLETPQSGAVYYDGHDLARLNVRAVRSRVSVVVQDASIQPGTVLDNIIGLSGDLTEDDAWRAASLAAIDEDIAAMPMQMQTVSGDRSAIFSGGQVQRIMLAAALVRDPSVLFLDEATNWLDNRSQAQVMQSISDLAITRFVIAHRLSTIRHADSIYVLQDGQVAQSGSFDDLIDTDGPFRDLARRQMA